MASEREKFEAKKKSTADFNKGYKYLNEIDSPDADTFNNMIELSLWLQKLAENEVDITNANRAGEANAQIVSKADGTPQFKLSNIAGQSVFSIPTTFTWDDSVPTVSVDFFTDNNYKRTPAVKDTIIDNKGDLALVGEIDTDNNRLICKWITNIKGYKGDKGDATLVYCRTYEFPESETVDEGDYIDYQTADFNRTPQTGDYFTSYIHEPSTKKTYLAINKVTDTNIGEYAWSQIIALLNLQGIQGIQGEKGEAGLSYKQVLELASPSLLKDTHWLTYATLDFNRTPEVGEFFPSYVKENASNQIYLVINYVSSVDVANTATAVMEIVGNALGQAALTYGRVSTYDVKAIPLENISPYGFSYYYDWFNRQVNVGDVFASYIYDEPRNRTYLAINEVSSIDENDTRWIVNTNFTWLRRISGDDALMYTEQLDFVCSNEEAEEKYGSTWFDGIGQSYKYDVDKFTGNPLLDTIFTSYVKSPSGENYIFINKITSNSGTERTGEVLSRIKISDGDILTYCSYIEDDEQTSLETGGSLPLSLEYFNRTPKIGDTVLCYVHLAKTNALIGAYFKIIYIWDEDKTATGEIVSVLPQGNTGAKIVSTELIGQDANGGNIYQQAFDNGVTAQFVAPKGEKGDSIISADGSLTLDGSLTVNNEIKNLRTIYPKDNTLYVRGEKSTLEFGVNATTPFIDFHYGNSEEDGETDYTSRIIERSKGVLFFDCEDVKTGGNLIVSGNLNVNGTMSGFTTNGTINYNIDAIKGDVPGNLITAVEASGGTLPVIRFCSPKNDGGYVAVVSNGKAALCAGESFNALEGYITEEESANFNYPERAYITADDRVEIITRLDSGWSSRKTFIFGTDGSFVCPGVITSNGNAVYTKGNLSFSLSGTTLTITDSNT